MPQPKGEGWRKMPSVTHGGSPFFYYRRNPMTDFRQWFMQDRHDRMWKYYEEDPRTGEMVILDAA